MATDVAARTTWMLGQEARALLTRLRRVKPFALQETMLPAAAISAPAHVAIERHLVRGRLELQAQVRAYLAWLEGEGRRAAPAEKQQRLVLIRMRFNEVLSQLDLFSDAITQRSESESGVFLSGLDALAADALRLPGVELRPPEVVCYLDRGPGAAIRRARTRVPGAGTTPVAIIRVPRERLVGQGIGSSLVHEVGHQGAALLDLVASLRPRLQAMERAEGAERRAWACWGRWISEIVADLWSVARLGIGSSLGLMAVISLPPFFVFRISLDDPHPVPWMRMRLSCAIGDALYPHPQWRELSDLWAQLYPVASLDAERRALLASLDASVPRLVPLLVDHRPARLGGRSLRDVLASEDRTPARLRELHRAWRDRPAGMRAATPTLAVAVIGQARATGALSPEEESRVLSGLLTFWALRSTLDAAEAAAERPPRPRPVQQPTLALAS